MGAGTWALLTLLRKLDETEEMVRYRFGPHEASRGVLELDKHAATIRALARGVT